MIPKKEPTLVILDTDFLLFCAQNKIDYTSEIARLFPEKTSIAVVDVTLEELERISKRGGKTASLVKLVKTILFAKHVGSIKTKEQSTPLNITSLNISTSRNTISTPITADDAILLVVNTNQKNNNSDVKTKDTKDIVVGTQDAGLKRRLRVKGVQIVTVRKRSHLVIE